MNCQYVLDFWFKEIEPASWWIKDLAFDQTIIAKFQTLHDAAIQGELTHWRETPSGRLAEVIILDQFSRNIYRDTPKAFAYDGMALVLAQEAIACRADTEFTALERSFFYLPFMHSESAIIHEKAVMLYQANGIANSLDFELQHKKIIDRFGRYPHRNSILNRESTADEIEFLNEPNSSF